MKGPWSLRWRLTAWFAVSSFAVLVVMAAATTWYVARDLERELDVLVKEEIEEVRGYSSGREVDLDQLREVVDNVALDHPSFRFTWRFWVDEGEKPWATFGSPPMLAIPARNAAALDQSATLARAYRWRVEEFDAYLLPESGGEDSVARAVTVRIGLLLDGSARVRDVQRSGTLLLGLACVAGIVAVLGGALFAKRVAGMLSRVAESAAAARLDGTESDARHATRELGEVAPEEIRAVTDAFRASFERIRAHHGRNVLLTAGLAHELRSPLQNMMAEAEVTLLRERETHEYREVLESQLEEMRDLARVVDNLITLTAIRDIEYMPRTERFDLAEQAELRIGKERTTAERAGVVLEVERRGDLQMEGDREALLLTLRNLVGNALRWSDAGDRVTLVLDGTEEEVVVTVDDEGTGVSESDRERIFEAFYQGDAPKGRRQGYGLGLALTRAAVDAHGGSIEVESSPSGGARFVVRLARRARGAAQPAVAIA